VGLLFVLGALGATQGGRIQHGVQRIAVRWHHPRDEKIPKTVKVSRALDAALKGLNAKIKGRTTGGVPVVLASLPGNIPLVRGAGEVNAGVLGAGGAVTSGAEGDGQVTLDVSCDSLPLARVVLSKGTYVETKEALLALVIDDLQGSSNDPLAKGFLDFQAPLTFSILPGPRSKTLAQEAREAGKEYLVHLPMEPKNYPEQNPGPQAIYVDLKEGEIRNRVRAALKAVPDARGVENHMGSRATEDPVVMGAVLDELKKRELYFVDAQTSAFSVTPEVAAKQGAQCIRSAGYFDDKQDVPIIQRKLLSLARTAQGKHRVLAIGHFRKSTLMALQVVLPRLREMGVELVPASRVIEE
jgi:polysaccharide deacetylase 2 family uncharacterized protein YibQ